MIISCLKQYPIIYYLLIYHASIDLDLFLQRENNKIMTEVASVLSVNLFH